MSDLISRSVFYEKLLKIECESSDKNYRNGAADMLNVVFQLLNNQPIAYDIDKVVEQIHGYFKSVIDKSDSENLPLEVLDYNKAICNIVRGGRE